MSKLHELLAVEGDLKNQAEACRTDLQNTFKNKTHHFTKKVVTIKSAVADVPDKVESQLALQTTIKKELQWISDKIGAAVNVGYQVDIANTQAKSDVVLDDAESTVLLKSVPTTALLRIEHRIVEVRDLINSIPTLDPAKNYEPAPSEGEGIYRAKDEERAFTEKKFEFVVMVGPTDKHPAQVKELMVDKVIGHKLTQEWSSLITVAAKGDMLDRVEMLLRAVKKARSRANEMDVDAKQNSVADKVLNFVFAGTK